MASTITSDLRSEAREFQRDKNHRAKWARGTVQWPAAKCAHQRDSSCDNCTKQPCKPDGRNYSKMTQAFHRGETAHRNTVARKVLRHDLVEAVDETDISDSSAGDDIVEASAAPAPDTGIMYSYDAHSGPGRGSQILSYAINQAVQRFENNETEKMVKEYDLVPDGKEELDFADAEDDFELIDAAQLK